MRSSYSVKKLSIFIPMLQPLDSWSLPPSYFFILSYFLIRDSQICFLLDLLCENSLFMYNFLFGLLLHNLLLLCFTFFSIILAPFLHLSFQRFQLFCQKKTWVPVITKDCHQNFTSSLNPSTLIFQFSNLKQDFLKFRFPHVSRIGLWSEPNFGIVDCLIKVTAPPLVSYREIYQFWKLFGALPLFSKCKTLQIKEGLLIPIPQCIQKIHSQHH